MLYPPKRDDLDQYFDEVSIYDMREGDVCIWEYGHIAVFDHWDGNCNWFFSQNPNPCEVMIINAGGLHAFRLKGQKKEITPNVVRDTYKDQIEVKVPELRVRTSPSLNGEILGYASIGFYNFYETRDNDNYTWYRIAEDQWIASKDEWTTIYYAEKPKDEYINLPSWIDERCIYNVETKEMLPYTLKPMKFGGLSYKIYSYVDDKYFAEIETLDYGRVLVRVTSATPITYEPQYQNGNY